MNNDKELIITKISKMIVSAQFDDIEDRVIQITKDRVIDSIGCIFGGATAQGNQGIVNVLLRNSKGSAPVFVYGARVAPGDAAFINCISCRSNDFGVMWIQMDGRRYSSHHTETTIPMSLTLADCFGVTGKEFLTNTIVGDDVSSRVQAANPWKLEGKPWSGAQMNPIFGAVPIAARYLHLDAEQTQEAFGIAGDMIAGSSQTSEDYSLSFKFGQGACARNGMFAAELAQQGFTGIRDVLFSKGGYYSLYWDKEPEEVNQELLLKDLGKKFYIEETFKRYPCGSPNAGWIMAGKQLFDQYGPFDPNQVEKVILHQWTKRKKGNYGQPFSIGKSPMVNGLFNFIHTVASMLLRGSVNVKYFTVEHITSEPVVTLCKKSEVVSDLDENRSVIEVRMSDGRIIKASADAIPQAFHSYPTRDELFGKYWEQVHAFNNCTDVKAQKIIDLVDHLEELPDMRELTSLLMPD